MNYKSVSRGPCLAVKLGCRPSEGLGLGPLSSHTRSSTGCLRPSSSVTPSFVKILQDHLGDCGLLLLPDGSWQGPREAPPLMRSHSMRLPLRGLEEVLLPGWMN